MTRMLPVGAVISTVVTPGSAPSSPRISSYTAAVRSDRSKRKRRRPGVTWTTLPIPDGAIKTSPTGDAAQRLGRCLLYTSDAADDLLCVDLGGRRIIKKKKK